MISKIAEIDNFGILADLHGTVPKQNSKSETFFTDGIALERPHYPGCRYISGQIITGLVRFGIDLKFCV